MKTAPKWQVDGLRNLLRECREIVRAAGDVRDECMPTFVGHENDHADLLYRIDCALVGGRWVDKGRYFGTVAGGVKERYDAPGAIT